MDKKVIFKGCATALITPFWDEKIDFVALEKIIEMQISGGVDALVIGGTTGEAATLCDSERYALFEFCKDKVNGRIPLIFGTGTNDTEVAVRHTRVAEKIGCDGVLTVTPYYNKGTEDGICAHYLKIAEASELPVLLYNVPTRTGVNLSYKSINALCEHPNIVGIKEASDSADRLVTLREYSDSLSLYAGSDSQIYTTLALGGEGVISVLSNAYPKYVADMCRLYRNGNTREALKMQISALGMIRALFAETNPAPIKYLMSRLGLCKNELRLPLSVANNTTRGAINAEFTLPPEE